MAVRSFVLVLPMCLGLWLGAWSCGPSHCGYNAGDATCAGRGASAPYCNLCVNDNDGCVATPPSDAGCVLVTDSGLYDPTVAPPDSTDTTSAPTTGPGPGPSPTTGEPPPPPTDTSSSTTTPVDPDTSSSSTTDVTTEAATSSSETTAPGTSTGESTGTTTGETTSEDTSTGTTVDESTGPPPPPMCGNGALEGMEECDGMALGDQECVDFPGKGGGTLACTQMCQFDLAGCCLANGQACSADAQCCVNSCKFDLLMLKNICKP